MRLAALFLAAAMLPLTLLGNDTKEQVFWRWFEANQDDVFHFEKHREIVFARLSHALNNVDSNLTFQLSPILQNGTREFVISAGGIQAAFPSVEALYAAAPKLPKWTIVKFRQRQTPLRDVKFAGRKVKSADVHYAIFKDEDPKKIGVMIFLDGYTAKEAAMWEPIGFRFLDEALGEYDVETYVGEIKFLSRNSRYFGEARPLSELPAKFDEKLGRKSRIEPDGAGNSHRAGQ